MMASNFVYSFNMHYYFIARCTVIAQVASGPTLSRVTWALLKLLVFFKVRIALSSNVTDRRTDGRTSYTHIATYRNSERPATRHDVLVADVVGWLIELFCKFLIFVLRYFDGSPCIVYKIDWRTGDMTLKYPNYGPKITIMYVVWEYFLCKVRRSPRPCYCFCFCYFYAPCICWRGTSHFRFPTIWHGSLLSGGGDRPFTDI